MQSQPHTRAAIGDRACTPAMLRTSAPEYCFLQLVISPFITRIIVRSGALDHLSSRV